MATDNVQKIKKFGHVIFVIGKWTDILIAILQTPPEGEVTTARSLTIIYCKSFM